jgi:hypothetical protein
MAEGVLRAPTLELVGWARVERLLRSNVCAFVLLVVLPSPLYVLEIYHAAAGIAVGSDFLSFWTAGRAVLHGHSPYPELSSLPQVADPKTFAPFVYPAPAAYWMVPFALLPFAVASTIFLFLSWGAAWLALRLLGVRDWRCYAAMFATVPIAAGTSLGSYSPWLLLGAAAAWRWRDEVWRVGAIVGLLVVAKVFLWPLWLWLVFTRRYAAAAISAGLGLVMTLGAWATLGFAGLHDYPHLLSRLTGLVGINGYSPFALLHTAGLSVAWSQRATLVLTVVLLGAWAVWLRKSRADDRSFVTVLGIALLVTPVLWPHYFALAFVPLAMARRTFSWPWALPFLLWTCGNGWSFGDPKLIVPLLLICATPFVLAVRRSAA